MGFLVEARSRTPAHASADDLLLSPPVDPATFETPEQFQRAALTALARLLADSQQPIGPGVKKLCDTYLSTTTGQ
jgi:hypothetical protein